MPTAKEWKDTGLIPTSGLDTWHMYEAGVSLNNAILDYSGNNRHLSNVLTTPILTLNAINGQPGWYFDGTKDPLISNPVALLVKHVFILASADGAAFDLNRGLLSGTGLTGGDVLASNATGTTFFNLGAGAGYQYRKSDVIYAEANQQAPMSGAFALIEVSTTAGIALDAIQIGMQRTLTTRKWKGYFVEQLIYNRVLTQVERERVMLYFNIKFAQQKVGLPFYFPSDDLMQFKRTRFYAEPPEYEKVTDSFEFADGGRSFNEVSTTAPRRWEYNYLGRTPQEAVIFDEFYNQARQANVFKFRDKYGVVWDDVRIANYNRTHSEHKSWNVGVSFNLIKYP